MLLRKKEEIEAWLNKYQIKNYKLIEDQKYGYIVDVNDNVILYNKSLKSIDIKFNIVKGSFNCMINELESLEGSPEICESFYCNHNKLKSLKYCPKIVNCFFDCSHNELETLEGSPKIMNGDFICSSNKLISLIGCPKIIKSSFDCSSNQLTIENLKYLPNEVGNIVFFQSNKCLKELQMLTNFKELQNKVNEIFKIKEEKENLLNLIKKDLNNNNVNKI